MDGSCWDRFGRKTLLTFTGYKDRAPGVMKELERVGMKDVNVQWQFPNPFESVLLKHLNHEKCLSTAVRSLPEDFDVALFDMFLHEGNDREFNEYIFAKGNRKVNQDWSEYDSLISQGCYAMSRRAMERYIWLNEAAVTDKRIGKLRIGDHFLSRKYMGDGMKLYFSVNHVAIQKIMGKNNCNTDNMYGRIEVDESLYGG